MENEQCKYYDQGWNDWIDGKAYEGGTRDYRDGYYDALRAHLDGFIPEKML